MVGNGCDPELRLSLGSCSSSHQDCSSAESSRNDGSSANSEQNLQQQQQQQQQITIFYNGQICVCNVTEFQARTILSVAKREMDDKMNKNHHQQPQHQFQQKYHNKAAPLQPLQASSSQATPQLLNQGLQMKRSLQQFLQKRKTRINTVSPYNKKHGLSFPSTS